MAKSINNRYYLQLGWGNNPEYATRAAAVTAAKKVAKETGKQQTIAVLGDIAPRRIVRAGKYVMSSGGKSSAWITVKPPKGAARSNPTVTARNANFRSPMNAAIGGKILGFVTDSKGRTTHVKVLVPKVGTARSNPKTKDHITYSVYKVPATGSPSKVSGGYLDIKVAKTVLRNVRAAGWKGKFKLMRYNNTTGETTWVRG